MGRWRAVVVGGLGVVALLSAGCSSDADDEPAATTTTVAAPTSTAAGDGSTTTTTAASTTSTSGGETTTTSVPSSTTSTTGGGDDLDAAIGACIGGDASACFDIGAAGVAMPVAIDDGNDWSLAPDAVVAEQCFLSGVPVACWEAGHRGLSRPAA